MILEPKKISSFTVSKHIFYVPWSDGTRCHDFLFFECWVLSQLFHFPLTFIKRLFSSSLLSVIRVVSSAHLGCWQILLLVKALFLVGRQPPSSGILTWHKESSALLWLFWTLTPSRGLYSPNDIPKTPPPNTITLGLRVSALEFWGIHKIQPRTGKGKFSRVDILFKR